MQALFHCPGCEQVRRASISPEALAVTCDGCHWSRSYQAEDLSEAGPRRCLVCGCDDLWRQKDFPQRLGVAMVALGAVLSTIAFYLYMPATALGVLLAFALVDLLLFTFMKDVLVCYRCHTRYRDAVLEDDRPRFNLETAERYRQEAARIDESRRAPSGTA